jgi:hypothetical protein
MKDKSITRNLTDNPDWKKNGKLYTMYDLKLKSNSKSGEVLGGVNPVFNSDLNTSQDNEPVNSIPETDDEETGVKVFSENPGKDKVNFKEEKSSEVVDDETFDELFSRAMNHTNYKKDNKSVLVSPDNVFDF